MEEMKRRDFLKNAAKASLLLSLPAQHILKTSFKPPGNKILFLGDSITQAGDYVNFFESQLRISDPDTPYEVYNLGLASETISGLSEKAHPFPRPYLHDRLEKVLDYIQPDILFACYGINCGIYHPFALEISTRYQQGIKQLISEAEQRNMHLILLTPPPYASPVDDWTKARADMNRKDYSYAKPYAAYDDEMRQYADWIMSMKEVQSIDVQTPLRNFQSLCYGEDVIHPNLLGHQLIARIILEELGPTKEEKMKVEVSWQENSENSEDKNVRLFHLKEPIHHHVVLSEHQEYNELVTADLDFTLRIRDCPPATYQLFDNHFYLGEFTHEALEKGILIHPFSSEVKYENLSFVKKARQTYDLVAAKREICDYALLQHIGHQRPMSRAGLPIALAEKKRAEINAETKQLLEQQYWKIEMVRL